VIGVGVWVGRGVEVGCGMRVCVEVGVRVAVEVGEAGTAVEDAAIVGDAAKATDVAVGSVGIGLVQLAIPSIVNSNVRPGTTNRNRL
jgi:hypothetical protein